MLLSVIVGLLTFFGTLSVNYLSKMNDVLNTVVTSDAVQSQQISTLQNEQAELKGFYQSVISTYAARKEDQINSKKVR
jgi:hypothetical protein